GVCAEAPAARTKRKERTRIMRALILPATPWREAPALPSPDSSGDRGMDRGRAKGLFTDPNQHQRRSPPSLPAPSRPSTGAYPTPDSRRDREAASLEARDT